MNKRTWRRKIGLVLLLFSLLIISWLTFRYLQDQPLLSPLSDNPTFQFFSNPSPHPKKVVYGFLPYWNLNKVTVHPELTNLAYFGLTIGGDGKLITVGEDGYTEPGFNKLNSDEFLQIAQQVSHNKGKMEIALTQFNNDDIVSFLNSETAQQSLITSLDSILLAYPIEGVNVDIEYSGEVTDHLRQNLVAFVTKLHNHLTQKYAGIPLSIDMYSSAASRPLIWDVEAIGKQVDYIVIMAYDFHRQSSPIAGPVAPLFGGKTLWDSDISDHLKDFIKVVPADKLLLGVPFYGYEWQTTSDDELATTIPNTGATASYQRVQEVLANKNELQVEEHWNEEALSPYLVYTEDDQTHVIYYDNSRSLSYKLDFVNQLDLGGIAIWALGYEGNYQELWDVILRKLSL